MGAYMKKLVLIGVAVAVLSLPAMAADLPRKAPAPLPPPAPVYNWTGFYVGVNGGWGWAKTEATVAQTGNGGTLDFNPASLSTRANGALFGGQVGYNYQFGSNWVLGIEGDFDGTGMSKSAGVVFPSLLVTGLGRNDGFAGSAKIDWLATVRGRLGYTWGPGMAYITGGGAWEEVNYSALVSSISASGVFGTSVAGSLSKTNTGWTLGAGFEYMLTPNWIARAEYLYYNFHNDSTLALTFPANPCASATTCGANVSVDSKNVNVLRVGLSYKF